MAGKKRSPQFKFKVVTDTLQSGSVGEVARRYELNATQVSNWRKHFLDNGYQIFESTTDKEIKELRKQIERLEQLLGKKEVELNFLRNYLDFYTSPNGSLRS